MNEKKGIRENKNVLRVYLYETKLWAKESALQMYVPI